MNEETLNNNSKDAFAEAAKSMAAFGAVADDMEKELYNDERKIIVERGRKTKNLPHKIRKNPSRPVTPKINRKLERGRNG